MSNEIVVANWDRTCPKCKSASLFRTPVANTKYWICEYLYINYSCRFTVNCGDKMGEGFDMITII